MKTPSSEGAQRCLDIRKRAKRGERLERHESRLCELMLNLYPEWYKSTEKQVFNETVPFGSSVSLD